MNPNSALATGERASPRTNAGGRHEFRHNTFILEIAMNFIGVPIIRLNHEGVAKQIKPGQCWGDALLGKHWREHNIDTMPLTRG